MMFSTWTPQQTQITPRLSKLALCLPLAICALTSLSNVCRSQTQESEVKANAVSLRQPTLISANGRPLGVGQVDLPLALAREHGWYSDQSVEVISSDCEIWLTTSALASTPDAHTVAESDSTNPNNSLLRIHFLHNGEGLSAFRIELGRRRASAKECRQLEAAAMVAEALGQRSNSKQTLIANNFLPTDFGVQPDGSHVELNSEGAFDSLRGKVGTFVPVADVATTRANQPEVSAYMSFAQRYRTEWPAMDPVLVSIASSAINESVERGEVQIHITPYARNEYRFLTNYLSQPSVTHAAMSHNELMGVSARLRTPSRDILAHLGVAESKMWKNLPSC